MPAIHAATTGSGTCGGKIIIEKSKDTKTLICLKCGTRLTLGVKHEAKHEDAR